MRPLEYGVEYFDNDPFFSAITSRGLKPYVVFKGGEQSITAINWEFTYNAAPSDLTHVRTFNGGSYIDLAILSSQVNDQNGATKHARKVKTWGVDEDNYLRVEEMSLSGTTSASGTSNWFEIGDFYCSLFGSGGDDALGNIDIGRCGKVTAEAFRIVAGTCAAKSCRVPIPKTWRAKILSVDIVPKDAALGITSGVLAFPHYYDAVDCKDEDSSFDRVCVTREGGHFGPDTWPRIYGNDTTYSLLEFQGIRANVSETWGVHAKVAMWATHDCSKNRRILVGDI